MTLIATLIARHEELHEHCNTQYIGTEIPDDAMDALCEAERAVFAHPVSDQHELAAKLTFWNTAIARGDESTAIEYWGQLLSDVRRVMAI